MADPTQTVDVVARKEALGKRQVAHLRSILDAWVKEAQTTLKEHGSQVLAANDTLSELLKLVEKPAKPLTPKKRSLVVLGAHRIWDYYRGKFSQRLWDVGEAAKSEDRTFLEIADQLAYDCYRIAGEHLRKAPPLVTLTGGFQPYVQKRNSEFAVEVGASAESLTDEAAPSTKNLPFPIIGLPWYQASVLEGLVLVSHEVGHAIEDDLVMTDDLIAAFGASDPSRIVNWQRWHRELFGDVWACLSVGPAFVHGLADQIARPGAWKEPVENDGLYPPAWLRIRFNCAMLSRMGLLGATYERNVPGVVAKWEPSFPVHPHFDAYLDDVTPVLDALFELNLPAIGKLGVGYTFSAEQQDHARRVASMMTTPTRNSERLSPSENREMRVAAAAVRLSFEASPGDESSRGEKINLLWRAVRKGFRNVGGIEEAARDRAAALFAGWGE